MSHSPNETSTVILGAGIIGVATAYYLSLAEGNQAGEESGSSSKHRIHLVENADEFFASASGKAGGFLAEDCMCFSHLSLSLWIQYFFSSSLSTLLFQTPVF